MTDQKASRRRDSAASRERLLTAARELFADRGYDKTTARDIGERAHVDPAMIARYFGGKAQLYIATLHGEHGAESPADLRDPKRVTSLVERLVSQGPGPVLQAAVRPIDSEAAQQAATEELYRRFIVPLGDQLERDGEAEPRLKAEVLMAALAGIALAQRAGVLENLATADAKQISVYVRELFGAFPEADSSAAEAPPSPMGTEPN